MVRVRRRYSITRTHAGWLSISDAAIEASHVHRVLDGYVYSSGTAALRRRPRDQLANFRWPTGVSILRILSVLWLRGKLPIQFREYGASSRAGDRALRFATRPLRNAYRVRPWDQRAQAGDGVWYVTEPGGNEQFLSAKRVIVSVQTIQSARLFLLSDIPNPNGLIGRFLTYHTKGDAHFTLPSIKVWDPGPNQQQFQPVSAVGSLQLRGIYAYKDDAGDLRKAGKFSVYDPFTCTTPLRLVKGASLGPSKRNVWGADLIQYLKEIRSQGGVNVSFTGDAMSIYENRVELDPVVKDPWGLPVAKTFYKHDTWDVEMSKYALNRVREAVENAGGVLRKFEPQDEANPGYGHVHGALRAGTDRGQSVLNGNCESHEVEGLYVLDAAWMPTAGASNPSLTLIANAYRVSEKITKP